MTNLYNGFGFLDLLRTKIANDPVTAVKAGNGLSLDGANVVNVKAGEGLAFDESGNLITKGGTSYTLPAATATELGGVKVGANLSISDGVLSVNVADDVSSGVVRLSHEVTNDSTNGVAVSPDAVFAYAPNRDTTPRGIAEPITLTLNSGVSGNMSCVASGNFLVIGASHITRNTSALCSFPKTALKGIPYMGKQFLSMPEGGEIYITETTDNYWINISSTAAFDGFQAVIPYVPNNQ